MIPAELEKLIIRHRSEGHLPFFVNCTTGTTVYGAFDPIEPIADICEKYGIWLHIDVRLNPSFLLLLHPFTYLIANWLQAAWGGGLLMSSRYRNAQFKGIHRYLMQYFLIFRFLALSGGPFTFAEPILSHGIPISWWVPCFSALHFTSRKT